MFKVGIFFLLGLWDQRDLYFWSGPRLARWPVDAVGCSPDLSEESRQFEIFNHKKWIKLVHFTNKIGFKFVLTTYNEGLIGK